MPLLSRSEILSFRLLCKAVQPGLCQPWPETQIVVFLHAKTQLIMSDDQNVTNTPRHQEGETGVRHTKRKFCSLGPNLILFQPSYVGGLICNTHIYLC